MKTRVFATVIILLSAVSFCFSQPKDDSQKPTSLKEKICIVEDRICKPLNLDKQQTEKVTSAFNEFFTEMEKLVDKSTNPPTRPDKAKADALGKIRDEKVKGAIPTTLFPKYLELELSARPKGPEDEGHRSIKP